MMLRDTHQTEIDISQVTMLRVVVTDFPDSEDHVLELTFVGVIPPRRFQYSSLETRNLHEDAYIVRMALRAQEYGALRFSSSLPGHQVQRLGPAAGVLEGALGIGAGMLLERNEAASTYRESFHDGRGHPVEELQAVAETLARAAREQNEERLRAEQLTAELQAVGTPAAEGESFAVRVQRAQERIAEAHRQESLFGSSESTITDVDHSEEARADAMSRARELRDRVRTPTNTFQDVYDRLVREIPPAHNPAEELAEEAPEDPGERNLL